jgi:hypothetical protein
MKSRDEVRLRRGLTTWKKSWLLILLGLGLLVGDVPAQSGDEKISAPPETVVSNYVAGTEVTGAVLAKPVTRAARELVSLSESNSLANLDSGLKNSRAVTPEIRVVNEWGVADYGLQKVYFPADLTTAPISIVTPDGRQLKVRATFLALQDAVSGQSILLGEVRPTEGEIIGDNTVLYPNAFDAIHADVRYRYTKYSLEQDIILHENVKLPEGFTAEHTRLEVWSEWLDSVPNRKEMVELNLRPEAAANHQAALTAVDEQLRFGAARIGAGHAFGLENEGDQTPVAKTFDRIEGRDWLIERVDYLAVQPRLDQLPQRQASLPSKQIQFDRGELVRSLQARLVTPPQPTKTLRLAQATPPTQDSLVLDFIIVSSVPVPMDVISWWPGAGNAADVYGINSGTAYGGMSYGPGKVGQGFVFDGVNDHIRVPHHSSFELTWALTIEAWIRPTNVSGYRSIFSKWDAVGGVNQRSYEVSLYPGGRCYLLVSPVGTDSGATFVLSSNAVPLNEWTHIAAVADGSTLKVYLNGVLDAEGEYYAGIYPGTNAAGIGGVVGGATPGNSISRFAGRIDEPAIYGRALGAAEILAIYEAGIAGKVHPEAATLPADLVAWWPGDDHAYDLADTNHATVSGATYAAGYVSQSFSFDGTNDGVNAADDNALNLASATDQLTIETWIKAEENDVVMSIAGKRHTPDSSTATGYELFLIYGSPGIQLATPERAENYIDWGSDLLDGGWHHLAVTVDRSVTNGGTLYVNGTPTLIFDAAEVSGSLSNAAPFRIGVHPETGFNGWFKGMIDEPTVYRRALSGAEITALYVAGSAGKSKLDVDNDGLPDWWEWLHFGGITQNDEDDYDGDGISNLDEYLNGWNPNTIAFQARFDNLYVSNRVVQGVCEITLGQPYEMAVLTNTTELAGAVWTNYQPNFTVTLPDEDGDHLVLVALRGRVATNPPATDFTELTLDRVAPVLAITNPILVSATATVIKPYLQLQGYANEPLASLSYDITNEFGLLTNELVAVVDQYFDTNKFDFTTNWFQGYDIALATNENVITLRVADLAGNAAMTNFTVILDYSTATNAPELQLLWPTNDIHLSGDSFYVRGKINDETASLVAEWVDANDVTNTVVGIVERNGMFWVEDLPLSAGVNAVRLIATDAAGNLSSTDLTVVQSSVSLTIDSTPEGASLYEPTGNVSGTVSEASYAVSVNGVAATVDENGNWTAENVPNNGPGTATFDATATPPGGGGGGGSGGGGGGSPSVMTSVQKELEAVVRITRHLLSLDESTAYGGQTWTKQYDAQYAPDAAGHGQPKYQGDASRYQTDPVYGNSLTHYQWSDADPLGTELTETAGGSYGPDPLTSEDWLVRSVPHKSYDPGWSVWSVDHYYAKGVRYKFPWANNTISTVFVAARTVETLFTGGKAGIARKALFSLTASATEYGKPQDFPWQNTPGEPVAAERITVAGKTLGADGQAPIVLPDNEKVTLSVQVKGVNHANVSLGAPRYKLRIRASGALLGADTVAEGANFCVGQKMVFVPDWDQIPAGLDETKTTYQWKLPGNFVNESNQPCATCSVNWSKNENLLTNQTTAAWWTSGGNGWPGREYTADLKVNLVFTNGQKETLDVEGLFNMFRPMPDFKAEVRDTVYVGTNAHWSNRQLKGGTWLHFGTASSSTNEGIAFVYTNAPMIPNSTNNYGRYFITQVVEGFRQQYNVRFGTNCIAEQIDGSGLDGSNPYGEGYKSSDHGEWWDSPGSELTYASWLKRTDSFRTHLMFQPQPYANSIAVPMYQLTWGWSGTARTNGPPNSWYLVSGTTPDNPQAEPTEIFPFWSDNIANYITTTNLPCFDEN